MDLCRIQQIEAHSAWILHAQYSPTLSLLATCSNDHSVKIWRTEDYALMHTLPQPDSASRLAWHPDGSVLLVNCGDTMLLWNEQQRLVQLVPDKGTSYRSMDWFTDGERFISGDNKGTIIANTVDGSEVSRYVLGGKVAEWSVSGLSVVNNSQFVAVLSQSTKYVIHLVALEGDAFTVKWRGHGEGGWPKVSPVHDSQFILVAPNPKAWVDMWNLHTQKVERQFERKSTLDSFYVFSGEFVVGGDGMGVSVWDRETGLVLKQLPAHTKSLHGIAINPQNLLNFVSYSTDGSFVVWSMNPQHKKPSLFSRLLKKPPN